MIASKHKAVHKQAGKIATTQTAFLSVDAFYSLFQKKRTFNSEFFCGPPGGGGPKIHMVDYVELPFT